MNWITIISNTLWFRCHPVTSDADGRALYPSWRASFAVARSLASVQTRRRQRVAAEQMELFKEQNP